MTPLKARQQAYHFAETNPEATLPAAFIQGFLFAKEYYDISDDEIVNVPSCHCGSPVPNPVDGSKSAIPPTPTFDDFYNAYGFKKQRKQAERMWQRLSTEKKHQIMKSIPAYLQYITASGTSQMYPASYINPANERWTDDNTLTKQQQPKQKTQTVYRNEGLNQEEQERARAIAEARKQRMAELQKTLSK